MWCPLSLPFFRLTATVPSAAPHMSSFLAPSLASLVFSEHIPVTQYPFCSEGLKTEHASQSVVLPVLTKELSQSCWPHGLWYKKIMTLYFLNTLCHIVQLSQTKYVS